MNLPKLTVVEAQEQFDEIIDNIHLSPIQVMQDDVPVAIIMSAEDFDVINKIKEELSVK